MLVRCKLEDTPVVRVRHAFWKIPAPRVRFKARSDLWRRSLDAMCHIETRIAGAKAGRHGRKRTSRSVQRMVSATDVA